MATSKEKKGSHFVSDTIAAATGQWFEVLARLGIDVPPHKRHGPCPSCGGEDRFRFDDKEGRGTWLCSQCPPNSKSTTAAGDGLDLVCRVTGKNAKEATDLVAGALGLSSGGLDEGELERLRIQQQARAETERKQAEQQSKSAASRAASIMRDATQGVCPYLEGKGLHGVTVALTQRAIDIGNVNFPSGSLIVPLVVEVGGAPVNVQLIDGQGSKRYLAGGQKAGAFHHITGGSVAAVGEGYATGLSFQLASEASIYCAMDAANLLAVAQYVRKVVNPELLILFADNDAHHLSNPGKTKAEQAAATVGGWVIMPPEPGDWNDYLQVHGLNKARAEIMRQIEEAKDAGQKEEIPWQAEVIPLRAKVHTEHDDLPEGFHIRDGKLYAREWMRRGENALQEEVLLASELRVLAETADENGLGHGRLLEWKDSTGRIRQWAMPMRSLVPRRREEVVASLLDAGLPYVNMDKLSKFAAYLMACQPDRRVTCVERTGWHGCTYVLPGGNLGPDAESVILQTTGFVGSDFAISGTLDEWQQQIAALAIGNSRLVFALSLAFAAPLLSLLGMEGGGFHLKGESTDGKTTIMKAAASVYGQPDRYVHTWRATGNAIEGIANRRNDALLCLDEIGEQAGKEVGQTAYMLANGQGKGRSQQDGELRERKAWRVLFLSTGELSLEDHAAEAGKRTQAGMEVRTIQIPSDTGQYGAFELLHGQPDGRAFADALNGASKHQHGTAFRTYIAALAEELDKHRDRLKVEIRRLADELTPKGAGNQVGRAINRFALVAAAGELATELGITSWPSGEALRAARACLQAWLDERGHLGNHEEVTILRQIQGFMIANQYTRFADLSDPNHRPANMVGYRKNPCVGSDTVEFWILPSSWKEMTRGHDPQKVARLCANKGWLMPVGSENRLQLLRPLPTGKRGRVYVLTGAVLGESVEGLED
ncbi:DUF927 domain-containing protein [Aeromonas caviae]|uniref:DUF927 domain-containing protein n=1 Tax=Aeromonas caviae TaxID=648 RepID=UPI00191C9A07|nr:DUF927 domain-containing protein [Aeromonas caviae]MBL0551156.1 DUF927 domain-containing protein [Aeromonas caviae]MDH0350799.1 DUF927 domain-containing protein [Aeromonas caviae]